MLVINKVRNKAIKVSNNDKTYQTNQFLFIYYIGRFLWLNAFFNFNINNTESTGYCTTIERDNDINVRCWAQTDVNWTAGVAMTTDDAIRSAVDALSHSHLHRLSINRHNATTTQRMSLRMHGELSK